jgi:hypothetical protein
MLKNIFWNKAESRLRAGWRLLFQFILFFGFIILFAIFDHTFFKSLPRSPIGSTDSLFLPLYMFLSGVISIYLFGRFVDKRRFSDFGLHFNVGWWLDFGFGFLLATGIMAVIFVIHYIAGWITIVGYLESGTFGFGFTADLILILLSIIFMAALEEIHSRGYQLTNLAEGLKSDRLDRNKSVIWTIIIISAIFGIFHFDAEAGTMSVIALISAGLIYSVAYVVTGELAIPLGFHIAWNFAEGSIFGFPVSGISVKTDIMVSEISGPEFWTGGAYGPELSPLGIGGHLIGLILVLIYVKLRYGKISNRLRYVHNDDED